MKRLRLEWNGRGATGPDGTVYAIQSERVRGEPAFYSPRVRRPDNDEEMTTPSRTPDFPDEFEVFTHGYRGRREQAIRWCEIDAERRQGKAQT